jgi:hypothetical protein
MVAWFLVSTKAVMLAFKDYALLKEIMKFGYEPFFGWDFTVVNFIVNFEMILVGGCG